MNKLHVKGFSINQEIVASLVESAVKKVEGVVQVGNNPITSSLISVFSVGNSAKGDAVIAQVVDEKLQVEVHVTVFFGYQFFELADAIREAAATAVTEYVGIEVGAVDVCIDALVFPKEK